MKRKNIIILMIDGGRLDYAQNSKIFSELKIQIPLKEFNDNYGPINLSMWKKYRKNYEVT